MEWFGGPTTSSCFPAAKKKRSIFRRRPHPDPKPVANCLNVFTLPNSPADYGGLEDVDYCSTGNLSMELKFESRSLPSTDNIRSDENKQGGSSHSVNENRLKKVKLKLGGVTNTLQAKSTTENTLGRGALQKQDFSRNKFRDVKDNSSRRAMDQSSAAIDEIYKYELGHNSKRVAKKRAVGEGFDDEDDEEIRYLKKLRASRTAYGYGDRQEESGRKTKVISKLMSLDHSDIKDGGKKLRTYEDNDYEMELTSDDELKTKRKKLTEEFVDPTTGSGQEMTMTTRKRALECPESGGLVEFPNGLPAAPSKKQKLSEVEQQLRKAEAAQRRRLQAEKAAKEAEAEAIRKILGQDSNRKKKEDKLKKQQEELAQKKTDKAAALGPNTIRWIMGPNGTVITFSEDIGLPKMLDSMPCRYPPPREKCVGPNCTNEYKYRDSKSKLPLCSLHCYRAVQGNVELLPAC